MKKGRQDRIAETLTFVIPFLYRNEEYLSYNQYYICKTGSYYK